MAEPCIRQTLLDKKPNHCLCATINHHMSKGKTKQAIPVQFCEVCQKAGPPDVLKNVQLREYCLLRANGMLMTIHSDSTAKEKGVTYEDVLGGLPALGKGKQSLRCYIYWLHHHSIIGQPEADALWEKYELSGDITEEEQDEIFEFAEKEKI